MMQRGEGEDNAVVAPDFQRSFVWTLQYQQELIETILLDKDPIPHIWLDKRVVNRVTTYYIVDGLQRLTTLVRFTNNKFPVRIRGKDVLYRELSKSQRAAFDVDTQINVRILINWPISKVLRHFQKLNNCKPLQSSVKVRATENSVMDIIHNHNEGVTVLKKTIIDRQASSDKNMFIESVCCIAAYALSSEIKMAKKFVHAKRLLDEKLSMTEAEGQILTQIFTSLNLIYRQNNFEFSLTKSELVAVGVLVAQTLIREEQNVNKEDWTKFGKYMGTIFHTCRRKGEYHVQTTNANVKEFYTSMVGGGLGKTPHRVEILEREFKNMKLVRDEQPDKKKREDSLENKDKPEKKKKEETPEKQKEDSARPDKPKLTEKPRVQEKKDEPARPKVSAKQKQPEKQREPETKHKVQIVELDDDDVPFDVNNPYNIPSNQSPPMHLFTKKPRHSST
jgi:hypothetical protein